MLPQCRCEGRRRALFLASSWRRRGLPNTASCQLMTPTSVRSRVGDAASASQLNVSARPASRGSSARRLEQKGTMVISMPALVLSRVSLFGPFRLPCVCGEECICTSFSPGSERTSSIRVQGGRWGKGPATGGVRAGGAPCQWGVRVVGRAFWIVLGRQGRFHFFYRERLWHLRLHPTARPSARLVTPRFPAPIWVPIWPGIGARAEYP